MKSVVTQNSICEVAPIVAAHANEIDELGTLPPQLLKNLREAGCFRMLVPKEFGGAELSFQQALTVIECLSKGDASTGWNVMIAVSNIMVLGLLPIATFEDIFRNGPDVILGGSHAPKGSAKRSENGYIFSGKWPFASGSLYCDYFAIHAPIVDNGQPKLLENGVPAMRLAIVHADRMEILKTWDSLGLRGTASHEIFAEELFIESDWTCQLFGATSSINAPIFSIPSVAPLALFIAAVAIGIASGIVDDVIEVALDGKRPAYGGSKLSSSPIFQNKIGELDVKLRAARALLQQDASHAWAKASRKGTFSMEDRARMRTASSFAVPVALEVAMTAYRLAGSSVLSNGSNTQRRLRDIQTLAQHTGVGPEFFSIAGALLVGEETSTMRI